MIQGFVHALRVQSKIIFIVVRNLKGLTQVVVTAENKEFETAKELTLESVIRVTGEMKETPQAPGGSEMHPDSIEILSRAAPELPIPVVVKGSDEETEAPTRFDYRWLDLRKPEKARVFKVWTEFEKGWRKYWDEQGYIQLYTPSFMQTPSESGADVFEVKYFDRKAYLAQSPQFFKQMAMASGLEKVFI
ncbi:MAG: amino acid--tRNA ligase-related protein, partial [bacterium]|nr:amino acid--tRNA ligase-related protein [bacterium]